MSPLVKLVETVALDAGIAVYGFYTNSELEFYFDFSLDGQTAGYISKGWTDPGLRIADVVDAKPLAFEDPLFFEYLTDRCALNGIAVSRHIDENGVCWSLESVVYLSGLNAATLRQVCQRLSECVGLVASACAAYHYLNQSVAYGQLPRTRLVC
jgi:hypothetical protein